MTMVVAESRGNLLSGRKTFITGASRGIGKAIAKCFAGQGAELHLNALNPERLEKTAQDLRGQYDVPVYTHAFDLSKPDDIKQAFHRYRKNHGSVDVLVNNAGIMKVGLLGMTPSEQMQELFSTNVFGAVYCTQFCVRLMSKSEDATIINIGSLMGEGGYAGQSIYGSSKAALTALTKSWAKELANSQVRVNAIAPGVIDTDMISSITDEQRNEVLTKIALGRFGRAAEVAKVALFLASDGASYITGQTIRVDGGMSI